MSQKARSRSIDLVILVALGCLVGLTTGVGVLGAQEERGTLEGIVRDALTGQPLPGVTLFILDLERTARSDDGGSYAFADLPVGAVNIRLEGDAYTTVVERLRIREGGGTRRDFELIPTSDALAVLIRGRRGGASSTILEDADLRRDGESVVSDVLLGGVSGIVLRPDPSGRGSARTYLRGMVSITGSNEPVVYVDGLRMTSGDGRAASILDQIDLSNVERIEVVRGSAAGVTYGPSSGNGAILVFTRRGGGA